GHGEDRGEGDDRESTHDEPPYLGAAGGNYERRRARHTFSGTRSFTRRGAVLVRRRREVRVRVEDLARDEDRGPGPEREGDGGGWPAVDFDLARRRPEERACQEDTDLGIAARGRRQAADDDARDAHPEPREHVAHEVVGERPFARLSVERKGDGVCGVRHDTDGRDTS